MAEVKLPAQESQVADSNETAKIAPKEAMPADNALVDMNKSAEEKPAEQKGEESKEDNATISSLQKELLDGKDISELEETAAGAPAAGGNSGDGVSLGAANFVEGGHESSVYADYNALG